MSLTNNQSFRLGDAVTILDRDTNQSFLGKIAIIDINLKMPRMPQYGFEIRYFVKFDEASYKTILLKGWHIYAYVIDKIQQCVITTITNDGLKVQIYDPTIGYVPMQYDYTIKYADIECILISQNAFDINKI